MVKVNKPLIGSERRSTHIQAPYASLAQHVLKVQEHFPMMKLIFAGAAVAAIIAIPALAQHAGGQHPAGHGAMMGGIGGRGFTMLDADKDGRVSMAEASSRALAMFDRVDANRDGTITMEERGAARGMMRGQRQQRCGG